MFPTTFSVCLPEALSRLGTTQALSVLRNKSEQTHFLSALSGLGHKAGGCVEIWNGQFRTERDMDVTGIYTWTWTAQHSVNGSWDRRHRTFKELYKTNTKESIFDSTLFFIHNFFFPFHLGACGETKPACPSLPELSAAGSSNSHFLLSGGHGTVLLTFLELFSNRTQASRYSFRRRCSRTNWLRYAVRILSLQ